MMRMLFPFAVGLGLWTGFLTYRKIRSKEAWPAILGALVTVFLAWVAFITINDHGY